MSIELRIASRLALLLGVLFLGGCATRWYERETVKLVLRDMDSVEIRHADLGGCLLSREVPVRYRVERATYVMTIDTRAGSDGPASFDLAFSGANQISARFTGLARAPAPVLAESGVRYRIDADSAPQDRFDVQVLSAGQPAGEETISLKRERCRALGLGR